jgi:uncharacterized protein YbjQ (UPF0145 family)
MHCKNCGTVNQSKSNYCKSCGKGLVDALVTNDYCKNCKRPLLFPERPCPYCETYRIKLEESICNTCKASLRKGIIFNNAKKLNELESIVLNIDRSKVFCGKCIKLQNTKAECQLDILKLKFNKIVKIMPVITVKNPVIYKINKYCGVVTAQTVIKIQELLEITHKNSEFNTRLSMAEKHCINSMKLDALKTGANAIIGCDIEYAELTNSRQTFMVAMMGTAVEIKELSTLSDYEQAVFNQLV